MSNGKSARREPGETSEVKHSDAPPVHSGPWPQSTEDLFAAFGGGVSYGPAKGDAPEDIATPNVGYGIGK